MSKKWHHKDVNINANLCTEKNRLLKHILLFAKEKNISLNCILFLRISGQLKKNKAAAKKFDFLTAFKAKFQASE